MCITKTLSIHPITYVHMSICMDGIRCRLCVYTPTYIIPGQASSIPLPDLVGVCQDVHYTDILRNGNLQFLTSINPPLHQLQGSDKIRVHRSSIRLLLKHCSLAGNGE